MRLNKLKVASTAFILSFMVNLSAFGDDLEIYLGTNNSQFTYKPNVLFIMDTSGSMSGKDNTQFSRMQRVQSALNQTLAEATNINAGLMRFSDHGGPVLYPITDIDMPVPPEIVLNTKASKDDAHEINNNVNVGSEKIVLTQGTKVVTTGLRFDGLNVPRGATITKAVLRFTSTQLDNSTSSLKIMAEASADGSQFESTWKNISDRPRTGASVDWASNNGFPLNDDTVLSPDFSAVIQEVVDQSAWCGGNALNLIIEGSSGNGSSKRETYSSDKGDSRAPQLVVSYDESTASGCIAGTQSYQVLSQTDNAEEDTDGNYNTLNVLNFRKDTNDYIGLRFQQLNIPQGANIKNAYLTFTANANVGGTNSKMLIRGVSEDSPGAFSQTLKDQLKNKPKTSASVSWNNIGQKNLNTAFNSPNIAAIIQEIVDRPGWQPRNNIMFVMEDFSSTQISAYTQRGKASAAPKLFIEFEGDATPGNSSTVRNYLISRVNELSTNGYTPIVDTLYEAAMYYGGQNVDFGRKRGEPGVSDGVRRATRVSHRDSYTGPDAIRPNGCTEFDLSNSKCIDEYIPNGATYISPVQNLQCQVNNHIVLLSDGVANNNHSVSRIQALLGKNCTGADGEKCGLDLVSNLQDAKTSVIGPRVKTHTIGFASDADAEEFLDDLADNGGGSFYTADDSQQLLDAFKTILSEVQDVNTTFVSPGVAVNQNNRLTHRDQLYFALFRPEEGALWPGNLKRYKIAGNQVLDANDKAAVDSTTGFFSDKAQSVWSSEVDGNDVRLGGAASRLDLVRSIYTFDDTSGSIMVAGNDLNENNSGISVGDLGITHLSDPAARRDRVLQWARGVDLNDADSDGSKTDINYMMGDPIHSQPVIVDYTTSDSAVFVATNHGFLHSFDAATGEENFAIIPRDLLGNLNEFYENRSSFSHTYGLDGDLVYREANGKRYLYVGMRRGGNNYYAFDITQKTNPKFVFKIDGGSADFANLGQSWSRPIVTKVKVSGAVRDVLIFGGGYDQDQDGKRDRSPDNVGNSVYIVDADTGAKLYEVSNANANLNIAEMQYSIPAAISVIDRNNDGLANHMYIADTGGQLFRLDINNDKASDPLVSGQLLAKLGGDAEADNRRFFYRPDVSEVVLGDEQYYAVALGSGFRAGPLNTAINDNFYMIKDKGVFTVNSANQYSFPSAPIELSNLYDATDHLLTSGSQSDRDLAAQSFATKEGWYMRLTTGGEKVLATPLILNYQIFFTTYVPAASSQSLCAPPTGNSRAYLVNMFNANAVTDLNNDSQTDQNDRFAQLSQTGIAPKPTILFPPDGKSPSICLGAECAQADRPDTPNNPGQGCGTSFECLAENIFGQLDRVQKDTWRTEVERQ
jgi:type IV pilus assembly protein PilY1